MQKKNQPHYRGADITRDVTVDLLHDMVKIQPKRQLEYNEGHAEKVAASWWSRDSIALPE
jgi:hypothetical protein